MRAEHAAGQLHQQSVVFQIPGGLATRRKGDALHVRQRRCHRFGRRVGARLAKKRPAQARDHAADINEARCLHAITDLQRRDAAGFHPDRASLVLQVKHSAWLIVSHGPFDPASVQQAALGGKPAQIFHRHLFRCEGIFRRGAGDHHALRPADPEAGAGEILAPRENRSRQSLHLNLRIHQGRRIQGHAIRCLDEHMSHRGLHPHPPVVAEKFAALHHAAHDHPLGDFRAAHQPVQSHHARLRQWHFPDDADRARQDVRREPALRQ